MGRLRLFKLAGRTLSVGPHWYFTLVMLAVINFVGGGFTLTIAPTMNFGFRIGGCIATLGSTLTLLSCAWSDPGLLQPRPSSTAKNKDIITLLESTAQKNVKKQWRTSDGDRICTVCRILQPVGTLHCEYCHVCVADWDHHCPWMGKCIGSGNIQAFYSFICFSFSSLIFIVASTLISSP